MRENSISSRRCVKTKIQTWFDQECPRGRAWWYSGFSKAYWARWNKTPAFSCVCPPNVVTLLYIFIVLCSKYSSLLIFSREGLLLLWPSKVDKPVVPPILSPCHPFFFPSLHLPLPFHPPSPSVCESVFHSRGESGSLSATSSLTFLLHLLLLLHCLFPFCLSFFFPLAHLLAVSRLTSPVSSSFVPNSPTLSPWPFLSSPLFYIFIIDLSLCLTVSISLSLSLRVFPSLSPSSPYACWWMRRAGRHNYSDLFIFI